MRYEPGPPQNHSGPTANEVPWLHSSRCSRTLTERILQNFLLSVPVSTDFNWVSFLLHWNEGGHLVWPPLLSKNAPPLFYIYIYFCSQPNTWTFLLCLLNSASFIFPELKCGHPISASTLLVSLKCLSKCIHFYSANSCFCLDDLKSVAPAFLSLMSSSFLCPDALWAFWDYSVLVTILCRKIRNALPCS